MEEKTKQEILKKFIAEIECKAESYLRAVVEGKDDIAAFRYDNIYEIARLAKEVLDSEEKEESE